MDIYLILKYYYCQMEFGQNKNNKNDENNKNNKITKINLNNKKTLTGMKIK